MDPEQIKQLQRAIRNAEDAGDSEAVRVLMEGYTKLDAAGARKFQVGQAVNRAMAEGDTTAARVLMEGYQQELAGSQESPPDRPEEQGDQPLPATAGQPAPAELTMRERGRLEGGTWTPIGAAARGAGSMLFGAGTALGAAQKFVGAALPGGEEPVSVGEALEYSRGVGEGAREAHPKSYAIGAVGGLLQGGALAKAVIPKRLASIFTLKAGQTARNIARLSAASAAAAGTTAGLEEGSEAVGPAAAVGAVAGPVVAGVVRGGVSLYQRISPENKAIQLLASRLKESPSIIAERYNALVSQFRQAGITRKPSLMELAGRETASEIGIIAARSPAAGRVLTEASEAAGQRAQRELPAMIKAGGPTTTLPEQQAQLAPITEETRRTVGSRVRSTETAQLGRRDVVMDRVMNKIGNHRIPLSDDLVDVLSDPDVQSALDAPLRRRIVAALDQGETVGSIDLSVRTWEMIRQKLAAKAGPGSGQIYSRLRDKVRDYVSERVPEYGTALQEFGRRSETAAATVAARQAVTKDSREFADLLKSTDAGRFGASARVGARVGVRNWLADQLSGTTQQAERVMARLARDNRLRANLREVLSPRELKQLEELSGQYGRQLNIIEGVKTGARVLPAGDAAKFQDAVRTAHATPEGTAGVRASARSTLAGAAGESPGKARGVAEAISEYGGLQQRISAALGAPEGERLRKVGEATTRGLRNLETAAPRTTEAAARAAQQAEEIKNVIGAATVASGHTGGAFKAAWAFRIAQRLRIGEKAAKRMAELAVDTTNADKLIRQLLKAGVSSDELLEFYRAAAVAAGVLAGQ